ncbi:MAG: efflux RND transporter periplasmic adaptor subunit [Isosphaeraceae bacterium]
MSITMLGRLAVPAVSLAVTAAVVSQSPATRDRLPAPLSRSLAWFAPGSEEPRPAPPPSVPRVIAEGRVVAYPGAEVVVGSEATGRVVRLNVVEKSRVKKGDLIAELNSDDLRAMHAEAAARIAEAEADIRFYTREVRRDESLVARSVGTRQNLDANRRALETAIARRDAAAAERDRQAALIAKSRVLAPIDGVVTARHVQQGETIGVADRVVTIVDLNRVRVEAEVDEYDTGRVGLGSRVKITSEGYPGTTWPGAVEEVPDSVVARRIRPDDPGRPIDARVLPVKIAFAGTTPLKLGQRVEVEIAADSAE